MPKSAYNQSENKEKVFFKETCISCAVLIQQKFLLAKKEVQVQVPWTTSQ